MSRRDFRYLRGDGRTPTIERPSHRRAFRQLRTYGVMVPDVRGLIYRFFAAESIADYESVATATWTSATVAAPGGVNATVYYHELTVADATADTADVILNPLRFSIEEPLSDGDNWEFGTPSLGGSGQFALRGVSGFNFVYGEMPPSGSHMVPRAIRNIDTHWRVDSPQSSALQWVWSGLQAINAGISTTNYGGIKPAYVRIRKNGVAYSSLIDLDASEESYRTDNPLAPPRQFYSTEQIYFDGTDAPFSTTFTFDWDYGDDIEFDVWYRVRLDATAASPVQTGARKFMAAISLTNSANGSRDVAQPSGEVPIDSAMAACAISPGYRAGQHKYTIEFVGGEFVPGDGYTNPQVMTSANGWTAAYADTQVQYAGTVAAGMHTGDACSISLFFEPEMASVFIELGTSPSIHRARYTPNGGEYPESVYDRDIASTINYGSRGIFNWLGTTTFEYMPPPYTGSPTAIDPELPTSVIITFGGSDTAAHNSLAPVALMTSHDAPSLLEKAGELYLGDSALQYGGWAAWQDVEIANGATISNAILVMTPNTVNGCVGPSAAKLTYSFRGVLAFPPTKPGNRPTFNGLSRTTAAEVVDLHGVANSPAVNPKAAVGVAFVVDVTAIVQEIINHASWTSGSTLAILADYVAAESLTNFIRSTENRLIIYT